MEYDDNSDGEHGAAAVISIHNRGADGGSCGSCESYGASAAVPRGSAAKDVGGREGWEGGQAGHLAIAFAKELRPHCCATSCSPFWRSSLSAACMG